MNANLLRRDCFWTLFLLEHKRCSVFPVCTSLSKRKKEKKLFYVCVSIVQCFFLCLIGLQKGERNVINFLITKRRSIIAPKSQNNYLVHPNGATFAIFNYFFWRFNSKIYGTYAYLSCGYAHEGGKQMYHNF